MASDYISGLANLIYDDLGSPSDVSSSSIVTKLTSEGFLGKLNNSIAGSYTIVSGDISPPLSNPEQSIYAQIYLSDYYGRKINQIIGGTDISFTTIRDGDSTITISNQNERAKVFKDLKKEADKEATRLAGEYRMNNSVSRTVDYSPLPIR